MNNLDVIKAWLKVILLGTFGKLTAKLTAPVAVLFVDRVNHPIWGIRDTKDTSYWNCAFRNAAHNMFTRPQHTYIENGNTEDSTLEALSGFQWRYRESMSGEYVSFRMTWGKPNPKKGKNEFYVGWTINEREYMRLTFFQLRPAWPVLVAILIGVALWIS